MTNLQNWVGREEVRTDQIRADPARFMQATLDIKPSLSEGDPLPPLWHWLYFLEAAPAGELGRDAHPKRGGFLPPVALPRRMWAGGRFDFHRPIQIGHEATKRSTIACVTEKVGRTGPLCFVTVRHEVFQNDELALSEEHDIVYRNDPDPNAPTPAPRTAPDSADFSEIVEPTEVMLFRYSALTFNGHRIHYDSDYARTVEGYDGLVFHGPLTATLLIKLAASKAGKAPKRFEFRGLTPLSGMSPFAIEGVSEDDQTKLWAKRADGALAMSATAEF